MSRMRSFSGKNGSVVAAANSQCWATGFRRRSSLLHPLRIVSLVAMSIAVLLMIFMFASSGRLTGNKVENESSVIYRDSQDFPTNHWTWTVPLIELMTAIPDDTRRINRPSMHRPRSPAHVVGNTDSLVHHPCENFTLPPPLADKKRTGPRSCPVCYIPVEEAVASMPVASAPSPVLLNLTYVREEYPRVTEFGGSPFGGHPSLKQRNNYFDVKEAMNVHCGFVRGSKPGSKSGFDIDDSDLTEMEQCKGIVVVSAIFGNYDEIQQPKNISEIAKKNICFYMFVDKQTESFLKNSSALDDKKRIGLWRIVVVQNLPYSDARRNGKVPKLLLHRLFPNARYSLWIDGKLELLVDPYQILERFLWRKNATFAISRHYRRFDVFEEAEANRAARKYSNASIDSQVEFYRREGLTPYSPAKLPITSDVPEGCAIIREHVPISNLFSCLWFNEVDRFTPRDQLSFSTVRDKIMSKVDWSVDMFKDCERRNFVSQKYHRDLLNKKATPITTKSRSLPTHEPSEKSAPKIPSLLSQEWRHRSTGSN